ncbi:hypothetical protein HYT26_01410 [Candidatus Pacearchaeota archaeon]|nr:hypothetical protein [Candidatus Pacearchaeota archaeon]
MSKLKKAKTETKTLGWAIKETRGMIKIMQEILLTKGGLPKMVEKDASEAVEGIGRIVTHIEKIVEKRRKRGK